MRTFTDNIVIGWPILQDGESETGDAFLRFSAFQVEMIRHGFFTRGALTIGDIYVDDIAVFGEGLVEAYRGESTLAQHPRIILCAPLVSLVREHLRYYEPGDAPQFRLLLEDLDGQWFIDYLDDEVFPAVDVVQEEFLSVHEEQIELNLRRFVADPRVWSKYCWIADYHNAFCAMHADQLTPGLSIDVSLFRSGPGESSPLREFVLYLASRQVNGYPLGSSCMRCMRA
jgi:hypothetical protein